MTNYIKIIAIITFIIIILVAPHAVFAGPSSTNYELDSYSFGAGGSDTNMSSSNYKAFGVLGEVEFGRPSSTNYQAGTGLTYLLNLIVPDSPTLSNPGSNYDRLKIVVNQSGNASDATYAIAISTDNFGSDTRYIKSDNTIGATLTTSDYQTYTTWGGASGFYVTGLTRGTTYYVKAKARIGNFTETQWGPASAGVATVDPSLTFSASNTAVTFNNLNAGNSYTDDTQTTVLTTSTNAYNGYLVNARATGVLTFGSNTIAHYTDTNATPSTWSGNGFGYTTSDSSLTGGTADRFTNGGAKFAGFTESSPGDPVADHPSPILSPITDEAFTITYRVTTPSTQTAGSYTTTVLYMVVPEY